MLFNSFRFLLFFAIVFPVYFALPHRHRWKWLLAASYYFYMCWKPGYVVLIVFTTLVDYSAGLLMESARSPNARRRYLILTQRVYRQTLLEYVQARADLSIALARLERAVGWI